MHVRCVVASWHKDDVGYWHALVSFEVQRKLHVYVLNLKETCWKCMEVDWDMELPGQACGWLCYCNEISLTNVNNCNSK